MNKIHKNPQGERNMVSLRKEKVVVNRMQGGVWFPGKAGEKGRGQIIQGL